MFKWKVICFNLSTTFLYLISRNKLIHLKFIIEELNMVVTALKHLVKGVKVFYSNVINEA